MDRNKQEFAQGSAETSAKASAEEEQYLQTVLDFLNDEIAKARDALELKKRNLYRSRQDEGVLTPDFSSPGHSSDLSQHLLEDERQRNALEQLSRRLAQDERMVPSPYFGRFDFMEEGFHSTDKIYVGLHNLYDAEGDGDILIYDWRAPICTIFYRDELGRTGYRAPNGEIAGEVTLKRQYRIEQSKLRYFFDCSLTISDDMLQEVLAHNASPQMQNIVRTIQSEQDLVIRDTRSDLLMAQGTAGSGKTTIALHRIAYLLYHGVQAGLTSKNIVIISLNDAFSTYIGEVLPQLGEENVQEITFERVAARLTGVVPVKSRLDFADSLISDDPKGAKRAACQFKGSHLMIEILRRFITYYEENLIGFTDIFYGETCIAQSGELREFFLSGRGGAPVLSRLRRIANILSSRIAQRQRGYHKTLEEKYKHMEGHQYDYKTVARFEAIKEANRIQNEVARFTKFSADIVYRALFSDRQRFLELCAGLSVPQNIEQIYDDIASCLNDGFAYDDLAPLCYLALLLDKPTGFDYIRHVVIDEAQDYLPVHYAAFGLLFKGATFTVLGDVGQAVETGATLQFYDTMPDLLGKRRHTLLTLKTSYRSSYEILNFALRIPDQRPDITPFERHEKAPEMILCPPDALVQRLAADITSVLAEGYETAAIICKTQQEANALFSLLREKLSVRLLESVGGLTRGVMILPAYLSKGLEFDCVFIPDAEGYNGEVSRRLLYIACTRALHRLTLYYSEENDCIKRLK